MSSRDSYGAELAVAKHKANRAIEHLLGMITGMVADGQLHDLEIKLLSTWMTSYPEATTEFPGSVIARKVAEILKDGIITENERAHLLQVGRVPRRGVSPQPGQAEIHITQRVTADKRVGGVSQRV
jgi:hypothetical protein